MNAKISEKVLIVDDEEDFVGIMAERMRVRGIEVATTTSAEDALKMVEKESYDVVIMDFMMPAMNGFKALKLIKAKKPEVKIILLSGNVPHDLSTAAIESGALDVIEKPPDIDALVQKIRKAAAPPPKNPVKKKIAQKK